MTKKNLDELIKIEGAKLAKLEEKHAELDAKIKVSRTTLEKYRLMKNTEQFTSISNALDAKGVSFDEVIAAINAGDLQAIQSKLDNTQPAAASAKDNG